MESQIVDLIYNYWKTSFFLNDGNSIMKGFIDVNWEIQTENRDYLNLYQVQSLREKLRRLVSEKKMHKSRLHRAS